MEVSPIAAQIFKSSNRAVGISILGSQKRKVICGGLFEYMAELLGFRDAKTKNFIFQKNIVDKLENNITTYKGGSTRLGPYVQSDWTDKMEVG